MVSSCKNNALRKMFPYLDIFWFAFSCMRTEYGDSKSSHYARMPENTDQRNSEYRHFSLSESLYDCCCCYFLVVLVKTKIYDRICVFSTSKPWSFLAFPLLTNAIVFFTGDNYKNTCISMTFLLISAILNTRHQ